MVRECSWHGEAGGGRHTMKWDVEGHDVIMEALQQP